jgi:hypothetical protein
MGLTSTAAICRLHREMIRLAEGLQNEGMQDKETPPDSRLADGGRQRDCDEECTGR